MPSPSETSPKAQNVHAGTFVGGNVKADTFVGRDMNVTVQLTGAEAEERFVQLVSLLRRPDVTVGDGAVSSADQLCLSSQK